MAEMTTLVAALYRKYTTKVKKDFDVISPGITSRYEIFYDESCSGVRVSLKVLSFNRRRSCHHAGTRVPNPIHPIGGLMKAKCDLGPAY
jgi:hypothetical protein